MFPSDSPYHFQPVCLSSPNRSPTPLQFDSTSPIFYQPPPFDTPHSWASLAPVDPTIYASNIPVHSPVPQPYTFPLLSSDHSSDYYLNQPTIPPVEYSPPLPAPPPYPASSSSPHTATPSPIDPQKDVLEYFGSLPQKTFPTPSELLIDLNKRNTPTSAAVPSPPEADKKAETQRKARHRAVAESVGFQPTDPDTISSHDKKRHFLECLEHYVIYMHEQLRLVNAEPVPLERVSTYRGLSSRSMRTLLVHMENTLRKRHERTLEEEQTFLELRQQVIDQSEAEISASNFRRHSIANGELPSSDQGSYSLNF